MIAYMYPPSIDVCTQSSYSNQATKKWKIIHLTQLLTFIFNVLWYRKNTLKTDFPTWQVSAFPITLPSSTANLANLTSFMAWKGGGGDVFTN